MSVWASMHFIRNLDIFDVLTPVHYLIGESLITIQEVDLNAVQLKHLAKMCTKIVSDFFNIDGRMST